MAPVSARGNRRNGAEIVHTSSYGPSAGGLYGSVGLVSMGQLVWWERTDQR
jgi:hypothetical protein